MTAGIKVIVLDSSGQYATELARYERDTESTTRIGDHISGDRDSTDESHIDLGGNWNEFCASISSEVQQFMEDDSHLRIWSPADLDVTRQIKIGYKLPIQRLTPAEVTALITEGAFEVLSDTMSGEARLCIVYEEAHSLVPEWSSTSFEGDRAAANRTAKTIMQGRKYGLGCLVVTQRTANVTKSILNQCNTVFAMRVFDATGIEFLKNYLGPDFASILSGLPDRQAVVFGRASSSREPVITELNDRAAFLSTMAQSEDAEDET